MKTRRLTNTIRRRIVLCATFFLLHSSFFISSAGAQGLPLIRNYTAAEYGGHNRNYDIEDGGNGTVFVANFEGLLYYDRSRWRMIHARDINRVLVVDRDSKNTVWVGGYKFFARVQTRANGELYMQQVAKDGLFDGEVKEIFEDEGTVQFVASDGNVYEVTENDQPQPIVKLKKRTKANFNIGVESDAVSLEALMAGKEDVLLDDIIQTVKLDNGLVAKVKKNAGLIIADEQGHDLYTITEANGLCSNQVSYLVYDHHGRLWGATSHGVFSIEVPSLYSYFLPKDGLTGEVHAITAFDGKIYVGTTNGLYAIEDDPLSPASRLCRRIDAINNICWTLCPTRNALLAATSSGIYKVARGGAAVSRLTSNATTAMLVNGDNVYAGEPDGVWLYRLGALLGPQGLQASGLPKEEQPRKVCDLPLVTEIRLNGNGGSQGNNLWLQTVHGETQQIGSTSLPASSSEEDDKGAATSSEGDGGELDMPRQLYMPVSDIEASAKYRHGSQIWIGGDEIIAIVDTGKEELAKLSDCRSIRFRSILMGNDSVLWGGYGDAPSELPKLGSNERHLHFYYALDYAPLSGKTHYRYKLNSDKWSVWSEKQNVEFLNLPHGSYTLSVQAQLANGELSDVASIEFSIAYPLLLRWYMFVVYGLLLIVIVNMLFRYRLKRLKKDKLKLEHIIEERTSDLRNAQSELIRQEKMATVGKLTEGLIDRILNPMNYIINFSKMSNDLLKDLKENIDNNQENIDKDDYEDTIDILGMLSVNLQNVDKYGQNTTRTLKAMEEMLKDRTGGYVAMDWLPVLRQNQEMMDNYFAKEKEQYHIHTSFSLPDHPMPLHGNPEMLSKTVMSLLGNAVYAVVKKCQKDTPGPNEGGYVPEISLSVTLSPSEGPADKYILKIRDNGTGIGEKTISKVFDPFFTTKTTAEAAGVGLYLSREIIQNHGGDISVASVKDTFTEFTITLPIKK